MSTTCSTSLGSIPAGHTRLYWQDEQPLTTESCPALAPSLEAAHSILLGESPAVRRLRSQVERIAPYVRRALVRGEAGSGKSLVARALHSMSLASGPFVVCRAAFLAETLAARPNGVEVTTLLKSVRGGTLYLEEVAEVPYRLQPRLLHFLTEQRNEWVSASDRPAAGSPAHAEMGRGVRIIGATLRDLRTLASIGQFRQDLYAELSVVELIVPPLRQRTEDLTLLAEWVLGQVSRRTGRPAKALSAEALGALRTRPWPGNLRELEDVVLQAATLSKGPLIDASHLAEALERPTELVEQTPAQTGAERLQDVIHQHVVNVLTRCGGNKLRAAEALGISRSTLYRMLDAGPSGTAA